MFASGPIIVSLLSTLTAPAVSQSSFDPATLPAQSGRVLQYSLTARGSVDGLILDDGTEVFLPPHLGPLLVQIARPGDVVTVHGLRAHSVRMMQAASVTNDATGSTLREDATLPASSALPAQRPRDMTVAGTVRTPLHGPRGDLNGALLEGGTIIRMPPPAASRSIDRLQPGAVVAAHGTGFAGPLGRMVQIDRIDPR